MSRELPAGPERVEVRLEVFAPGESIVDHRGQTCDLVAQAADLPVHLGHGSQQDLAPLGWVGGRPETDTQLSTRRLVLEQVADLGQREPGILA